MSDEVRSPHQRDQEVAESEAERFARKNTEWHDRIQERTEAMRQEPERKWVKVRDLSDDKDRFSSDAQVEVVPLTALTQERQLREEAERRLEVVQRNHGDRVGECAAERQARKAAEDRVKEAATVLKLKNRPASWKLERLASLLDSTPS